MDKFIKTDTGGLPLRLDDLIWEQGELDASNFGIYQALQADLLAYGTDYIVEGCTYGAPNITAGWIMLASELLRVDAHAGTDNYFAKVSTFDARGDKTFKDASSQSTYQVNRGVLNAASGSLNITTALRLEDKVIQLLATSTEEFAVANIPNLPASKTTSGTFAAARIPQATEGAVGGGELVTQAEMNTGTDDTRIVTALKARTTTWSAGQIPSLAASIITSGTFAAARIPQATTTAVGGAEFATQTEVNTGTDATRFIAPSTLRGTVFVTGQIPQATEGAKGGAEIATIAETSTGTDDTRMITPLKLNDYKPQAWATATLGAAWTAILSQTLRYRKINSTTIQVICWIAKDATLTELITTLPAGFRPSNDTWFPVSSSYDAGSGVNFDSACVLKPDGKIEFNVASTIVFNVVINAMIPLNL